MKTGCHPSPRSGKEGRVKTKHQLPRDDLPLDEDLEQVGNVRVMPAKNNIGDRARGMTPLRAWYEWALS